MGKKLYVGNLTFSVTNADLEELFAPFGEVRSAQVVEDRQTGRSRGFGFVEMASDADALAAIDALHDQEHNGRRLTVNEAKPREDRGGGGGGGYRGGGGSGGGIAAAAVAGWRWRIPRWRRRRSLLIDLPRCRFIDSRRDDAVSSLSWYPIPIEKASPETKMGVIVWPGSCL